MWHGEWRQVLNLKSNSNSSFEIELPHCISLAFLILSGIAADLGFYCSSRKLRIVLELSSELLLRRLWRSLRRSFWVAMSDEGPTLERSGEMRERPSLEGEQQHPSAAAALHRTPEIHETQSGNVELRKDPDHTSKLPRPEQILDPRINNSDPIASQPHDILAFQRSVNETDTPLE